LDSTIVTIIIATIGFPGGGWILTAYYNGTNSGATTQNMIFVYTKFRVTALGWIATRGLSQESIGAIQGSGNCK